MDIKLLAITVTIVLAITGYLYNYFHGINSDKRKERLNLLNKQLNDFYGPLYILTESSKTAITTLRHRLGGVQVFKNAYQPTDKERSEWYNWVISVLMPINERIENIILSNAHLIREEEIPRCLLQFVSHISTYRAIIEKWEQGDFKEYLSPVEFPSELHEYSRTSYYAIKKEQIQLISK